MARTREDYDRDIKALSRRYALRAGVRGDTVDDLLQEFDIKWLIYERAKPDWMSDPVRRRAVARKMIANLISDFQRGRMWCAGHVSLSVYELAEEHGKPVAGACLCAGREHGPEAYAVRREFWEVIGRAMSKLRPSQHALVADHCVLEMTAAEIARGAGCSLNAMEHRLSLARQRLIEKLSEIGYGEAQLRILCFGY